MSKPMREESDSLGRVNVAESALWGAQTQRSLENFPIGDHRFPPFFIHAFALVKKAAALTNAALGKLDQERCGLIVSACDEIMRGDHMAQFPLSIWQTGSGTQTNMNLNEVIANRGNELAGNERGSNKPLHPNDHVNMSHSSNDVFPTVMHVAVSRFLEHELFPAVESLVTALDRKSVEFADSIKSGRTHMMDATPVTLGQEFSAFRDQLGYGLDQVRAVVPAINELAIGGSAVGTGLNTEPEWAEKMAATISDLADLEFTPARNRFMALAGHEALVDLHGRLNVVAGALFKMASDIRLMNSGPRCGLAEIRIPANEPGSSIMPGKVNPTQVEALTMVCLKVMGNNASVGFAGSQGHFQLNVFKPLIIHLVLESLQLLSDAMKSFEERCLSGIQANEGQLRKYVDRSLMLVTALSPRIGYDNAARVAKLAQEQGITLKQAVLDLGLLTEAEFDAEVDPGKMLSPRQGDAG